MAVAGRMPGFMQANIFFTWILERKWNFDLFFRLNRILPDDIALFDIIPMEAQPHARFDAIQRVYDFFIHTYKDPFPKRKQFALPEAKFRS